MKPIPERVRDLLVCPICRGELKDLEQGLLCPACRLVFPVVDGVPILLEVRGRKFRGERPG